MDGPEGELLDRRFRALGDPTRRRIWRLLGESPGASTSRLGGAFPGLTRWAVMKHLHVLREAGLIQTLPEGRQRRHYRDERALDDLRAWLASAGPPGGGGGTSA